MRSTRRRSRTTNRWSRSEEKEKYWREHVSLWRKSGLSVRAYCQQYNVIETSFYAWRRELSIRDREETPGERANSKAVVKDKRGRSIPTHYVELEPTTTRALHGSGEPQPSANPFVALALVQNEKKADEKRAITNGDGSSMGLVITTPGGFSIQLTSARDIELLRTVVQILEECKC